MPTFTTADGRDYTTDNPAEVTRLRMSRHYVEAGTVPVTIDDARFHPASARVADVLEYLAQNPADRGRVIAEEQAGQNRVTITSFGGE